MAPTTINVRRTIHGFDRANRVCSCTVCLLPAFACDADRCAADAAARGAAGAAGGAHHHGGRGAPVAAAGQVAAGHFACARAGLALLVGADAACRGAT